MYVRIVHDLLELLCTSFDGVETAPSTLSVDGGCAMATFESHTACDISLQNCDLIKETPSNGSFTASAVFSDTLLYSTSYILDSTATSLFEEKEGTHNIKHRG
ncbi:hypothetical protein BCR33DRAFT_716366 [Rhizoclosmatium globosum]|uniref:Uncharacterized protein n=1 Tax=Rhizoclosmatium globosum TaxID=329046 RepID=A0A1Y2CFD8_9FUNG|nr:hypothetical protein BCR33DRAFT_716366 [Rhizoclosmatium globosum]|eukprot:ORY45742.1 hypothetical protein BCR33DRAFT_716366 [Rhizoclosmatium globosum]